MKKTILALRSWHWLPSRLHGRRLLRCPSSLDSLASGYSVALRLRWHPRLSMRRPSTRRRSTRRRVYYGYGRPYYAPAYYGRYYRGGWGPGRGWHRGWYKHGWD